MAHCDEYLELISASLDGALSPAQQEALEAHLAQCPQCKALYEELSAVHSALAELPPVEVPAGLTGRIMDAVAAEKVVPFAPAKPKKTSSHWQRWLSSAAVLALVLLGTWAWRPWESRSQSAKAPMAAEAQSVDDTQADTGRRIQPAESAPEAPADAPDMASLNTADAADSPEVSVESALRSAPAGGNTAAKMAPEQDEAVMEAPAAAPQLASMDAQSPLRGVAPEGKAESGDASPVPAQFSAPVPTQAPEEDGASASRSFMVATNGITNEAESPELTPREALERLVAYIFEYSSYDSVEYTSREEGLSAHVAAQGSGGDILLLPQQEDETLYRFEFRPETGGVYSYTVSRLTGEHTFLSEE